MRRFAHILNPVAAKPPSDLCIAQPITFESMRVAKEQAKNICQVELFSAQYPEDHDPIPDYFTKTPNLTRSMQDMENVKNAKKLPLLRDILNSLYAISDAEYFIYTNVDIALQKNFYTEVNKFIDQGNDSMVINRRTISDKHTEISDLTKMYVETGDPHIGYDCFVFKRDAYPKFDLGNVCIGAMRVGGLLVINMACFANNFREFKELFLTFHIGDSVVWQSPTATDMQKFNQKEFHAAAMRLAPQFNPNNLPDNIGQKALQNYFDMIRTVNTNIGRNQTT